MFPQPFFDAMCGLLDGRAIAEDVEARLGASASGTQRLDFYRVLARRDVQSILTSLFQATAVAAERARPALFADLVDEYARTNHSRSVEPNRYALGFPAYIEKRRVGDPSIPEALPEVADHEFLVFYVTIAPGKPFAVRQYAYDVRSFVRLAPRFRDTPWPTARETVVLVDRDDAGFARIMQPTREGLVTLANARDCTEL